MLTLEVYTFTDQPTTCPKCGNRTEIIADLFDSPEKTQHHCCLSTICSFKFVIEEDN